MIEGKGCGQYGEDRILALVFRDQPKGFLVDVGAANGYDNSNSIGLLQRPGWKGILIEPELNQFVELTQRYAGREGVVCVACGIGSHNGVRKLYAGGQVSTFHEATKKAAEDVHHIEYVAQSVMMCSLTAALQTYHAPSEIDFLSIDAEGMNYEVWSTLDRSLFNPRLVCIEGKGYSMGGYRELCRLGGNTFYIREDACPVL